MKHEPRTAINMEKQLGWACKLGGTEPLGTSKVGQKVLARLVEYQIWCPFVGSVGVSFRKGGMVSACLDARHFSFSLHTTVPLAATPVLELRGIEYE